MLFVVALFVCVVVLQRDGLRVACTNAGKPTQHNTKRNKNNQNTNKQKHNTTKGYDMDYTLIHYDVNAWEGRAYDYGLAALRAQGVPVDGLRFDAQLVMRGLIMDKESGNLIKVDRFGCGGVF